MGQFANLKMTTETKSESVQKPDVKSYSEVIKGKTKFLTEFPLSVEPGVLTSGKETRQTTEHERPEVRNYGDIL